MVRAGGGRRCPSAHPHLSLLVLHRASGQPLQYKHCHSDHHHNHDHHLRCPLSLVHHCPRPRRPIPLPEPAVRNFLATLPTHPRRTHRDHSTGGARKRISTNMTDGRMQLAMDESDDRKKRDARAIRWVIDNLTEDSELEPFVLGVPGSFNSNWGQKVWEFVALGEDNKSSGGGLSPAQPIEATELAIVSHSPGGPPSPSSPILLTQRENTIGDPGRITSLLRTCADPGVFPTEEARPGVRGRIPVLCTFHRRRMGVVR